MTTLDDHEFRLKALEDKQGLKAEMNALRGEMRGKMIDLREDVQRQVGDVQRQQKLHGVILDSHTTKLGDLDAKVDTLIESVAELRRLFIARGDNGSA